MLNQVVSKSLTGSAGPDVTLERLSSYRDQQVHAWKVASALFGVLGLLSFLFASAGTYALVALWTRQHEHEMGILLAIGATPRRLVCVTLMEGMTPVIVGALAGSLGAFAVNVLLKAFVFGVAGADVSTVVGVICMVCLSALIACLVPAMSAARIDPAATLRSA